MRGTVIKRTLLGVVVVVWLFAMHRLHPNLVPDAWTWLVNLSPFYGLVGIGMAAVLAWLILSIVNK